MPIERDWIRILYLLVSTSLGGGPKHVYDVVRRLPHQEFRVLIAAQDDGPFFEAFKKLGVKIESYPLHRLSPLTLVAVVRLVRERGIQIIHSHGKGAGLYGRLAGWWCRVPTIHTFHGIHYQKYPLGLRQLYLWLERRLSRLTRAVIHVSESQAREAEMLRLSDPTRTNVVVSGIDIKEVRALAEGAPLSRQALGLAADAQLIGCVARFDRVKRLDLLIEVVNRLVQRHPRLVLVLVGGGTDERKLRQQVERAGLSKHVYFTGPLADAPRLFPILDLYVSASRGEGLPLSLLEAMACGLPVVATRVTGQVDVVVDGVTGLLTRPEDPDEMAEAVACLLDDARLRRQMGQAGSERVETSFNINSMVSNLVPLYRSAASRT